MYRVQPFVGQRWPTMQEIRAAGKSVIVVKHNAGAADSTGYVWDADGLLQTSNWPRRQNFDSCVANDGLTPVLRGRVLPRSWWDVAEGRATTNSGSFATGLLWEDNVAKAVRCGAAVIGMDFIHTLNSSYNVERQSTPDRRMEAIVWSWEENDFGRNGPAAMMETGRWRSTAIGTSLPFACAAPRPYASTEQDRQWRITTAESVWNEDLANARCTAEFGPGYVFAKPENGYQNGQLRIAAAGRRVWINHTASRVEELSLRSSELVFSMRPGDPPPAPQTVLVAGAPGTPLTAKATNEQMISLNVPANALQNGEYRLPVTITPAASRLPAGMYEYGIDMYGNGTRPAQVTVRLFVQAQPQVTVVLDSGTVTTGARS